MNVLHNIHMLSPFLVHISHLIQLESYLLWCLFEIHFELRLRSKLVGNDIVHYHQQFWEQRNIIAIKTICHVSHNGLRNHKEKSIRLYLRKNSFWKMYLWGETLKKLYSPLSFSCSDIDNSWRTTTSGQNHCSGNSFPQSTRHLYLLCWTIA